MKCVHPVITIQIHASTLVTMVIKYLMNDVHKVVYLSSLIVDIDTVFYV